MNRQRWPLATAFVLALAARLAFGLGYWVGKPFTLDEQEYLTLGRNLAAGRGLVYDTDGREHFGRAPGYPAFLAGVFSFGGDTRAVKVAQAALGALGVLLIAALARRAGDERAGVVAAFVAALYPPLVWIPAYMLSETLYSALALAAALALWTAMRAEAEFPARTAVRRYFAAGIATGLAALVRPATLPFLGLAVVALSARRSIAGAAALFLGSALTIAPWAAFKTLEAHRLVLIASEGGVTFWTGNHPLAIGEGDMAANPQIRQANDRLRALHPALTPEKLESIYYQEAFGFIRSHPFRWAGLLTRKLFYLWIPIGPSYTLHSPLYHWASLTSYLSILPFAAAGWWWLARQTPQPVPLWLLGGSVVLTCLVFSPQERFRIPVLDPVMLVGASALTAARSKRRRA